jgi:hypothetical protein
MVQGKDLKRITRLVWALEAPRFKSGRRDHSIRQIILNVIAVFAMRFRVQRTVPFRRINHA